MLEKRAKFSMGASRGYDLVTMSDGSKSRVDDLKINDLVLTHSGKAEPVCALCKTQWHDKLYHIVWKSNLSGVALSYEHPVLILKKDDVLSKNSGGHYNKSDDMDSLVPEFTMASKVQEGDYVLEFINSPNKVEKLKFDSFYYKKYIAHKVECVICIDNDEPTYYVQIGDVDDKDSDHSYILNDIATHNCKIMRENNA